MAGLKGGSIVTVGNGATIIDRIQTAGPGQVNIPTEKINELGNYKSVATVRDTPDLTFSYESFDVSTECEAFLTGQYAGRSVSDGVTTASSTTVSSATAAFTSADVGRQIVIADGNGAGVEYVSTIASITSGTAVVVTAPAPTATTSGKKINIITNGFDLSVCQPVDIASQFKAGKDALSPFNVVGSVAVPFLYMEQMSYRFGLRDNAGQQGQLRGDTIFYNPGSTYVETAAGTNSPGQTVITAHPAYQSAEGDQRRVLAVTIGGHRLTFGADYTESYGAVTGGAATTTVTLADAVPTTSTIRIIYASPDVATYPQNVHQGVSVKPAAVKGRDIEIYLGGYNPNDRAGSQVNRATGLQSLNADWRVTLEKDEELGNYYAVAQDFEVPAVTGSLDFKPTDAADLQAMLAKLSNVSDLTKVIGTSTSTPIELDVVITDPDTHKPIKRINIPDARFTIPGFSGRVLQKTVFTINFESDEGSLFSYLR